MVVSLREHNGVLYLEHSKTPVDVRGTFTHDSLSENSDRHITKRDNAATILLGGP